MARIRKVEINNFRGVKSLEWHPSPGLNCLIGPGDSGKSTILDAIDLCLGARRNVQFTDADFHRLAIETPITISVTLGALDDRLKNIDAYGLYVRSYDSVTGVVEDEPEKDAETVLTVRLTVTSELEPAWSLVSERAEAQGLSRNLSWADRVRLAPTRIGMMASHHLGWQRGSVLNSVSEERADASAALVKIARDARTAFGEEAMGQLSETLGIVEAIAKESGIYIGENIKAMLDANSVSFSGGTISLHDENGIPLRGLGIGSTRLLIAGLQRKAADQSTMILIDELEHGLEPHRIIRLLGSLGAKEKAPPLQVFMTTHSPVALRELSGDQLFVTRRIGENHTIIPVGTANQIQSTIRLYPDAFLAPSVVICEGASEVGLLRGIDQYLVANNLTSISAIGAALVDCGGGTPDKLFERGFAFQALGYRVAVVRDDDVQPLMELETAFIANGGRVVKWRAGRALEDELFLSLTNGAVGKMINKAVELHGEDTVDDHIKSASSNKVDLSAIRAEMAFANVTEENRQILGKAARRRKAGWFKSVTWMEEIARDIVSPDLTTADAGFSKLIGDIYNWAGNKSE